MPDIDFDADDLRTPPHDIAAEQAALGGMMLNPDVAADVLAAVAADAFYRPAHRVVYTAISDLLGRGEPTDAISVSEELTKCGEITRVGGSLYLHTLTESVPTAANAVYYARIVGEKAMLRRLIEAGTHAAQMGYAAEGEAVDLVDAAQAEMMAITEQGARDEERTLGDVLPGVVDRMQQGAASGLIGISTGFADLDALTQGLKPGQLVVVGARPSLGKTTLALDFARAAALHHDVPTAVFSLEMGEEELTQKIVAAEARVPLHVVQAGNLEEEDWAAVGRVLPRLAEAPLVVDDDANRTIPQIRSLCRRMKRTRDLRLVVVDYLQLVTPTGRNTSTRQEDVAQMSRELKLLAKELGVTVIALSQLNRGPEQRTDRKPQLSDLRESGAVEQDADIVVLLHREDFYDKEASLRAGEADLIVAKHRNGPTATVTVAFQGHYSRFVDMAPAHMSQPVPQPVG